MRAGTAWTTADGEVRWMSAVGHERPSHSAPVPINARFGPKADKRGRNWIVC